MHHIVRELYLICKSLRIHVPFLASCVKICWQGPRAVSLSPSKLKHILKKLYLTTSRSPRLLSGLEQQLAAELERQEQENALQLLDQMDWQWRQQQPLMQQPLMEQQQAESRSADEQNGEVDDALSPSRPDHPAPSTCAADALHALERASLARGDVTHHTGSEECAATVEEQQQEEQNLTSEAAMARAAVNIRAHGGKKKGLTANQRKQARKGPLWDEL